MSKNKGKIFLGLAAALVFLVALFGAILPGQAQEEIAVYLDGETLAFDQPPIISNGRTLVPLRGIFEALGAEVGWDNATQTVSAEKGETIVYLFIGQKTAYINGEATELDVPAQIVNNRTLVPLRFVSEALGANVAWDGNTRTVTITSLGYRPKDPLKVHFLDVGQADAILVQLPGGKTMLIDAGNNADGDLVVNHLKEKGVKRVDFVIGTHPHEDHIGGLDDVISSFDIGKVYLPKVTHTTKTYEDLLTAVQNKGLKITPASAGTVVLKEGDLAITLAGPARQDYTDLNNWSVVTKIEYGNTTFLFAGDAEEEAENDILRAGADVDADLLKVGHHGSSTSTTAPFLKAVSPDYAVISVGTGNDYGHPSPETVARLEESGVTIYRTDLSGTITAASDGQTIVFDKKASPVQERAPDAASQKSQVVIAAVDLSREIVEIRNQGDTPVDVSGWKLVSEKGSQEYIIPANTVIATGGSLKIVSGANAGPGPNTLIWTNAYIWNNGHLPHA